MWPALLVQKQSKPGFEPGTVSVQTVSLTTLPPRLLQAAQLVPLKKPLRRVCALLWAKQSSLPEPLLTQTGGRPKPVPIFLGRPILPLVETWNVQAFELASR